ncbi:receptor expression-enhancing protein 3 [Drosophila albomicans]|uniref:Receptor expression-enhancing protein n=1 Tax=Drosophila albomicans TaxID=7291 RepID=A0A6P8WRL8_DROAB|nr:receptor expression-enhancing protein 3 [Drosophila albomicans]
MLYEFVVMVIGCVYPAYATYSTLSGSGNQQSQLSWMKYWIVFGGFIVLHFISSCIEFWVPFLASLKLCLLLWLLPSIGGGCHLIHDEYIAPLLMRNQETIYQTIESLSHLSCTVLRELVKWVYNLLVDVVEKCWQLTRNANDINVTPRLQVAINEVISELRAAHQAAALDVPAMQLPALEAEQGQEAEKEQPEESKQQLEEFEQLEEESEQPEESKQVEIPVELEPKPREKSVTIITADDVQQRIQLAEGASALRMQLSQQFALKEYLVPINRQLQMEEADRAYLEYCEEEQH